MPSNVTMVLAIVPFSPGLAKRIALYFIVFCVVSILPCAYARGAPAVFWASDPVRPNETALIVGHEFRDTTEVRVERLRDLNGSSGAPSTAKSISYNRKSGETLYFSIPADFDLGVYKYEIVTPDGSVTGLLNKPALYWVQGDLGPAASPGSELRVFGRCVLLTSGALLAFEKQGSGERTVVPLSSGSPWTASALVPAATAPGVYNVSVWNGHGDIGAWSNPLQVEIRNSVPAVGRTVSVLDYGGRGDGLADDSAAVEAGLADLAKTGGTLLFPRGRFFLKQAIAIPKGVTLRGVDKNLSSLLWPDFETPPESLISGESDFSIEDLSLYASNHRHIVSGGFGAKPGANIHIRRVRIRASAFRGHITESEISRRLSTLKTGVGGPNGADAIRLRGINLEISGSDILSSASSLFILDSEGVLIADNILQNGRGGWYSISGSRTVLIERNEFVGMDLGASGGGINTLFSGNGSSENIWLYKNRFRMMYAWDREAITTHYLIVENDFADAGTAVQLYGTSVEQIVAGNSSERTAGFINQGRWYEHFQPSWYIQYLDNRIVDGTVYRGGPDNLIFSGDAVIGVYGLPDSRIHSPLVLGIVVRGNRLAENARIDVGKCGGNAPTVRGIVIEKNVVLNNVNPISGVERDCDGLARDNAVGKR